MLQLLLIFPAFFLLGGSQHNLTDAEYGYPVASDFYEFPRDRTDGFYFAKTACLGTCPVYELYLYPDGLVIFTGHQYIENVGTSVFLEKSNLFDQIQKVLEAVGFYSFEGRYSYLAEDQICGEFYWDAPSTILAFMKDYEVKGVFYNFGCRDFPGEKKLRFAIQKIEEILDVQTLIGNRN